MTTAGQTETPGRFAWFGQWCQGRPSLCGAAGFAMLTIGGWVFLVATGIRAVGFAVLTAVLAAVIGGFGLLVLNEPIRRYVGAGNRRRGLVIGLAGIGGGVVVAAAAVGLTSPILAILGAVLFILGLLAFYAGLVMRVGGHPGRWLVVGLILVIAAPVMVLIGDGTDGISLTAALVWAAGLVAFKASLGPWIDQAQNPKRERIDVTVAAVVAIGVGVALLAITSGSFDESVLLAGLALVIVGLSALGVGIVRFAAPPVVGGAALVVGLAGIGWAATMIDQTIGGLDLVLAAVVGLAGIGAWFVFRGEAVIAVLLLGFVLGWVLVDRTSDADLSPTPTSLRTVVALGDSYISGEGAPQFFPGTNLAGADGNQCRRAPTAYPYLVADRLGADLVFLACAGARAEDLDGDGDPPVPYPDVAGTEDQLQRFAILDRDRVDSVDAVLISVGGNDVGFSTIVQACLLPQSCVADADLAQQWLDNVGRIGPRLAATYRAVRDTVGDDTPVVAMLYPVVARPTQGCDLVFDESEIEFVGRFTDALNAEISRVAAQVGVNVVDLSDAFDGRTLCGDDPAVNGIQLAPTEGPVVDRLNPTNWVHGSLHPRVDGHRLIADLLIDDDGSGALAELIQTTAAGGLANPPAAPGGADADEDVAPPTLIGLPDQVWIEQRLFEAVGQLLVPVGLLLIGGLLAAFGVIRLRVPLLSFLEPMVGRNEADEHSEQPDPHQPDQDQPFTTLATPDVSI